MHRPFLTVRVQLYCIIAVTDSKQIDMRLTSSGHVLHVDRCKYRYVTGRMAQALLTVGPVRWINHIDRK
jgi:uncharacterized metal-binding protein